MTFEIQQDMPRLAYIRWHDACYTPDESEHEALGDLVELHEIGFVVKETEHTIVLCVEHQQGEQSSRLTLTVPRVNIVEQHDVSLDDFVRWLRRRKKT